VVVNKRGYPTEYTMNDPEGDDFAPSIRPKQNRRIKDGASASGTVLTQSNFAQVSQLPYAAFPVSKSQAHLQVDFTRQMGGAGVYTIQFYVVPPGADPINPAFSGFYQAIAVITFSVEGNFVKRVVSIGDGVSISGCGQAVEVDVYDTTPPMQDDDGNPYNTPGLPYTVGILVTEGTRASTALPPTYINAVASDLSAFGVINDKVIYPVPVNAGVVSAKIFVCNNGQSGVNPNVTVQQLTPGAGIYPASVLAEYNPCINTGFEPIVPGCQQILIINNATTTCSVMIIWGVDG
jgi:hypothetical protein